MSLSTSSMDSRGRCSRISLSWPCTAEQTEGSGDAALSAAATERHVAPLTTAEIAMHRMSTIATPSMLAVPFMSKVSRHRGG